MNAHETSYQDVKNIMTNSIEEFFHKIEVKKGIQILKMGNYIIEGLADTKEGNIWEPVEHIQPHLQAGSLRLHLPSGKGEECHHYQPLQGDHPFLHCFNQIAEIQFFPL